MLLLLYQWAGYATFIVEDKGWVSKTVFLARKRQIVKTYINK